ncbi:hypothetical protein WBG83_14195 [Paenibacillus sp. y28]
MEKEELLGHASLQLKSPRAFTSFYKASDIKKDSQLLICFLSRSGLFIQPVYLKGSISRPPSALFIF